MSIDINSQRDVNVGGDVVGRDKITSVTNYYRAPSWAEAKHQRNRTTMIQNVRNFWVKGVLENSLYGAVLLQLGLEYKPEAVEQPWNVILRCAEQPDQELMAGAQIIEIFDEAGGALLILCARLRQDYYIVGVGARSPHAGRAGRDGPDPGGVPAFILGRAETAAGRLASGGIVQTLRRAPQGG